MEIKVWSPSMEAPMKGKYDLCPLFGGKGIG
jgi:hypothetical protein